MRWFRPRDRAPGEHSTSAPAAVPEATRPPPERRRRRALLVGALVFVLAGAAAAAAFLLRSGEAEDDGVDAMLAGIGAADGVADMPMAVEGTPVVRDTLVLSVRATGQAAAWRSAVLRAQVAGQVLAVPVRENARVAPGALLVALDPEEHVLALHEAEARLAQTTAQYREATLFDERIENVEQRQARAAAARARTGLEAAELAVSRAELNVRRTRLTAPFAGVVANVNVMPGYSVAAGDELMTVQATDPLRVEVQVLENEVGTLRPGGAAHVTFAAFPGTPFEGRIESINPVVEQQSRTARVTVIVANPGGRILPGMYATVALAGSRLPDRTFVPRDAILERDRRSVVIVFIGSGDSGHAEPRTVTTGVRTATHVEILPDPVTGEVPLRPGEIVLTAGHGSLQAGTSIRLAGEGG
jgi:membrane fusion protein, multidrug efflux system